MIGREVLVTRGTETFPAKAVGIDEEGGLLVETPEGIRALHSGEVSVHLPPPKSN